MTKLMYALIALGVVAGVVGVFFAKSVDAPTPTEEVVVPNEDSDTVMCTMDALECPDGSFVGRTGPNCEFVCPPAPTVPADIQASIDALADQIVVTTPVPLGTVSSPLTITGEARGPWFFEASFPVVLTNWDGLIIAEGIATAEGEWMTTDFVPFIATLEFTSPYEVGQESFMSRGSLILKKDNPSGLPENDAALEFPVTFSPVTES